MMAVAYDDKEINGFDMDPGNHRAPGVVLCPNCKGQKTVSRPPHVAGDIDRWESSGTGVYECPTCKGKGYIVV